MARSGRSAAKVILIATAVVVVAAVVMRVRQQQEVAAETADSIRSQLDDLDPVTRAAVRAQLAEDAAAEVRRS